MFTSKCELVGNVHLPAYSGIRVMMMPIVIDDISSIPSLLVNWHRAIQQLFEIEYANFHTRNNAGKIGYLTIDEKEVFTGHTHRRAGLHVDGVYRGGPGSWAGGGWGGVGTGMLTTSNVIGCRAWRQDFDGWPGSEGECESLRD